MSIGSIPNKFEWTTNVIEQLTIDKVTSLISRLKKVSNSFKYLINFIY